ncbi:dynamin-like [Contarinia nasturtii]|uniref:dynamin-like n=1 Tax=Contarinia nasturtii TaxID=265458 RepID=UPI0012D3EFD3|nr:dynamin-like [Contarinia nasturtii]
MLPTSQTVNKIQQDNEIGNSFEGVENTVEVKSDDNKSTSSEEGHDSQPEDNQFVNSETNKKEEREQVDPTLNGEVEVIYEKIDSYMRIVKKTTRDMVPKATTLYVIKELQEYINNTLLIELLALPTDVNTKLFALSSVEAEKHKEKEKTYEACKEALEIIRDVSMETGNGTITDNGF